MTDPDRNRPALGVLLVALSAVAFAVGPSGAKIAFDDGSNAITVVALRGVVTIALMALLVAGLRQSFRLRGPALKWSLYCGVFYAFGVYCFIAAVATIPISAAVLIFFTHPLLLAGIAHVRGDERLDWRKLSLAVVVLAGLAMALGPAGDLDPGGLALAALSSIAMCGMIYCIVPAQRHAGSAQINLWMTAAATLGFAAAASVFDAWALPQGTTGWIGIAAAGFGLGIGLLTYFAALRYLSPVRTAMLGNLEPLASSLFAALALGQVLQPLQWAGVAVVIVALVLFEAQARAPSA